MRHSIRPVLSVVIALLISTACLPKAPAPPLEPVPVSAGVRLVVDATFRAPTITPTPSPTSTITRTPTPTQATPSLTPTSPVAQCVPAGSPIQTAKVTSVIDGETIQVSIEGKEYTVRYIGISAPKITQQPYGTAAAAQNRALVDGQTVRLVKDTSDTDQNGRLLRYVFAGSTFANLELVRLGLANAVANAPDTACFATFLKAENEANAKREGLWSKPAPTKTPFGLGLEHMTPDTCNCFNPQPKCSDFPNRKAAESCFDQCVSIGLYHVIYLIDSIDEDYNFFVCTDLP